MFSEKIRPKTTINWVVVMESPGRNYIWYIMSGLGWFIRGLLMKWLSNQKHLLLGNTSACLLIQLTWWHPCLLRLSNWPRDIFSQIFLKTSLNDESSTGWDPYISNCYTLFVQALTLPVLKTGFFYLEVKTQ